MAARNCDDASKDGNSREISEVGFWRKIGSLGSGGFGEVCLWRNEETGQRLALKTCTWSEENLNTHRWKERWEKEVEMLQGIQHPNIVKAFPTPEPLQALSPELPLLCMEYCTGGSLRQLLSRPENCCGIPESSILLLIQDVVAALTYLHSLKIIHRDIKPENIVLQPTNKKVVHKLIDLGYAKDVSQNSACKSFVGTLQYLAPELFGSERYTATVDYWSLGVVLFECVTGVRPFLPNLSGIQWMRYVENKEREIICVYQRPDGEVVHSNTLFRENHINNVLKSQIELWLRVLLDWDPHRRGRDSHQADDDDSPRALMDLYEEIVETKVINILHFDTMNKLSYGANEQSSVVQLHSWIERDTGIPVEDQLLLTPKGTVTDRSLSTLQLFSLLEGESNYLLFLFKKSSVLTKQCHVLNPVYPEFLHYMLNNPRASLEYYMRRRCWAQAVYFLRQEAENYKRLFQGQRLLMMHVTHQTAQLRQYAVRCHSNFNALVAQYELFNSSLKIDEEKYAEQAQRGGLPSDAMVRSWLDVDQWIRSKIDRVKEKLDRLDTCVAEITATLNKVCKNVTNAKLESQFDAIYEAGLQVYENIRRVPRDERGYPDDSVGMAKIVLRNLKARGVLLDRFYETYKEVQGFVAVVYEAIDPIREILAELEVLKSELFSVQTQRQTDVWTVLERAVTLWQRASVSNTPIYSSPVSTNQPQWEGLSAVRVMDPDPSGLATSVAITENQTLRYELQDRMTKALTEFRSLIQASQKSSCLDDV